MRCVALLIVLAVSVAFAANTIQFSASFDLTSPAMKNGGGFVGNMNYSWDLGAFRTDLHNHGIQNLQIFTPGTTPCASCREKKFCTYNLDLNVGDTFNIRDWIWYPDDPKRPVDFKECNFQFYYQDQTNPPNWHLAEYNVQAPVTVLAADADNVAGTGNHGDGAYRIFMKDNCGTDDHMTIRVFAQNIVSDISGGGAADRGCAAQPGFFSYEIGSCGCSTIKIDYKQPQLFYNPAFGYYSPSTSTDVINGVTCNKYVKAPAAVGEVATLWVSAADNLTPCRAEFTDGRVFTFSNVNLHPTFTAATFAPPTTCACSRPVDLVIALEKSSSTTAAAFQAARTFAQTVSTHFQISGSEAQIAIATFGDSFNLVSQLVAGASASSVNAAIGSLTCSNAAQCAPNTGAKVTVAVAGGVDALLGAGSRIQAVKSLVIVTDGWTDSIAAVQSAVAAAQAKAPTLQIFVVGSDGLIFSDMSALAGGVDANVVPVVWPAFSPDDSSILASRVCKANAKPCGDCCGICECDQCVAPDHCDLDGCQRSVSNGACCAASVSTCVAPSTCDTSVCVNDTCVAGVMQCLPDSVCFSYNCANGVCQPTPKPPPAAADQCSHYECDTTTGVAQWVSISKTCTGSDPCLDYVCDPTVGCKAVPKSPLPPSCTAVAQCNCATADACFIGTCTSGSCHYAPKNCDDQDACTTDTCSGGSCVHSLMNCDDGNPCTADSCSAGACVHVENTCDDGNACTNDHCEVAFGCLHDLKDCNDDNLCTDDTCNTATGVCAHAPHVCDDGIACTKDVCNPSSGCEAQTISCPATGSCTLDFCQADANGNATCASRKLTCSANIIAAAVGGSIGAAAIAGIVIGVVVLVAAAGGGSFAAYKRMNGSEMTTVENNPIYTPSGASGANPLYARD